MSLVETEFLERFADAEPIVFTRSRRRWMPVTGQTGVVVEAESFNDEKLESCRDHVVAEAGRNGYAFEDC